MKKTAKKVLSAVLVVCLLIAGVGAYASESSVASLYSIMWTHINALGAGLSIGTWGYSTCSASLELTNSSDTSTMYMYLQRYVNGSWTYVTSWSTSGSEDLSLAENYYVTSGYYYRVHVIAHVYTSGTLVETATQDSNSVYY